MSNNLKNCFQKLKFISEIKSPVLRRKLLFQLSDECLYKALHEIALNVVNNKIPLSKSQKQSLKKYNKTIKALSKKQKSNKRKKNLVKQSGGFLPILIPAVASILGALIK